jgi:hypothetical protein
VAADKERGKDVTQLRIIPDVTKSDFVDDRPISRCEYILGAVQVSAANFAITFLAVALAFAISP